MEATALAVVANEEALGLPSGPMSDLEKRDRDNYHHKIKACSEGIGAALSYIYNNRLFRGDDGKQSWEFYLENELPAWLQAVTPRAADYQRLIHEATTLIEGAATTRCSRVALSVRQADVLKGLIPRRMLRHEQGSAGSWNPAILDDPDAAEGIAKVWELACSNAEANQRRNGPTAEDVRAAREELRPVLEKKGLIRSAPAAFRAATAARVEAAQLRTINVTAVDPAEQERKAAAFRETMANIRETKAERQVKVEAEEVREELSKADRERAELLQQEVRAYNTRLHGASKAIHELFGYLQNLSRIHGTQLLDEMRTVDVLGLITVSDDMQRLQEMGQELMEAVKLARSSDPSTGIDMQTIDL